ncbi:MAG: carboxymuconolactone decarboxylase family protein [Chitinophagaceae bacterium]|nr:MAG: carboxymuconolactone decarboxylase family protein [Chitinophagaceae bacterium]
MGRISLEQVAPGLFTAMNNLKDFIIEGEPALNYYLMIDIRTSILNGCEFCTRMHTNSAITKGMSENKIAALRDWTNSGEFDVIEQAVLRFTDEVALIHQHGVSDEVYNELRKHFSESGIVRLLAQAVLINGWNRIVLTNRT